MCPSYSTVLEVYAIIYHNADSKAEGYPAYIRVVTPTYLAYIEGSNTFSTNYTDVNGTEGESAVIRNTTGHSQVNNMLNLANLLSQTGC